MSEQERVGALQQYILHGVQETGVELGRGSYAIVCAVEYKGLTCAAKKIHRALREAEYSAERFQEECALLSQLRHPNIVQFLGVYNEPESTLPALVMEYLPLTLAQCLDQYGILSNEVSYSILKDVALALSYLHQQSPPIIHRDLSANNVLLTSGMTAKVSDLGVAKIYHSQAQWCKMTQTPGNLCYMPPESLVANPAYNCKVDVFSYGILIIHLFSGRWPFPTVAVKMSGDQMIPQSEADRRQEYLNAMGLGRNHPLRNLILECVHNSPTCRPDAVDIVQLVDRVAVQYPASSSNKVELLQQVASLRDDTEALQERHEAEVSSVEATVQNLMEQVEYLRLQLPKVSFKV